jgi:hypothetical protein
MLDEIILKAVLTIVSFSITGLLGFMIARLKDYKKRDKNQEEALKCLLKKVLRLQKS